jgi:hypothetical protein
MKIHVVVMKVLRKNKRHHETFTTKIDGFKSFTHG